MVYGYKEKELKIHVHIRFKTRRVQRGSSGGRARNKSRGILPEREGKNSSAMKDLTWMSLCIYADPYKILTLRELPPYENIFKKM